MISNHNVPDNGVQELIQRVAIKYFKDPAMLTYLSDTLGTSIGSLRFNKEEAEALLGREPDVGYLVGLSQDVDGNYRNSGYPILQFYDLAETIRDFTKRLKTLYDRVNSLGKTRHPDDVRMIQKEVLPIGHIPWEVAAIFNASRSALGTKDYLNRKTSYQLGSMSKFDGTKLTDKDVKDRAADEAFMASFPLENELYALSQGLFKIYYTPRISMLQVEPLLYRKQWINIFNPVTLMKEIYPEIKSDKIELKATEYAPFFLAPVQSNLKAWDPSFVHYLSNEPPMDARMRAEGSTATKYRTKWFHDPSTGQSNTNYQTGGMMAHVPFNASSGILYDVKNGNAVDMKTTTVGNGDEYVLAPEKFKDLFSLMRNTHPIFACGALRDAMMESDVWGELFAKVMMLVNKVSEIMDDSNGMIAGDIKSSTQVLLNQQRRRMAAPCGAGSRRVYVDPEGRVIPDNMMYTMDASGNRVLDSFKLRNSTSYCEAAPGPSLTPMNSRTRRTRRTTKAKSSSRKTSTRKRKTTTKHKPKTKRTRKS